jgi:hypothetical protein
MEGPIVPMMPVVLPGRIVAIPIRRIDLPIWIITIWIAINLSVRIYHPITVS